MKYQAKNVDEKTQNKIIELLIHDKKNESGIIQFTLLNSIGNFIINQTVDNEIISRSFFDYKT